MNVEAMEIHLRYAGEALCHEGEAGRAGCKNPVRTLSPPSDSTSDLTLRLYLFSFLFPSVPWEPLQLLRSQPHLLQRLRGPSLSLSDL